jgi:NTE family protein
LPTGDPVETRFIGVEFRIDTLDSISFPRRGCFFVGQYLRYDAQLSPTEHRDPRSFDTLLPFSFERYTLIATLRRADTGLDVGERLGGPFNLTGTRLGEIAGARSTFGRVFLVRNISDAFGDIVMPIYLGASFETGYARGGEFAGPSDWQRAFSVFLAADSIVGPVYLVAGKTFGGGSAIYLMWGRPR